MKKVIYTLITCVSLLAFLGISLSSNAQGGVYFREGFEEGMGWPSSAGTAVPQQPVVTPGNGTFYTFGAYRTTGATGSCPEQTGGASHLRFANLGNVAPYTANDSAYLLTPLVNAGIFNITFLNGRASRRLTIYKTADEDPNTENWTSVIFLPATNTVCQAFTVEVNDPNAKRLKIIARGGTDSDIDTLVMTSVGVLPTRFGALTLQQRSDEVVANFNTFNESNVFAYHLQRSIDGVTFTDVNFTGARNQLMADYSLTDRVKGGGVLFYRIKGVDVDGKTSFSSIAKISLDHTGNEGVFIVNPVRGNNLQMSLNGLTPGTYQVAVNNISGRQVAGRTIQVQASSMNVSLELPATITRGMYVLSLTGSNYRHTTKVVVE